MTDFVLNIKNITKEFPGVKALDNVTFSVRRGSVHALVGENGAGKSTLMKILYGNHLPDSGTIEINGKEVTISSPIVAQQLGLSIIFQELNLIPLLTIAENIFMGRMQNFFRHGRIDWKSLYAAADETLKKIGLDIDSRTYVQDLSVAEKQLVEIAKAIAFECRILLMDEPSAMLTKRELNVLFQLIRELKKQGITIVYISHRMEEIFEICDTVTVIRDGRVVDTQEIEQEIEQETNESIIRKMVGREMTSVFPKHEFQIGEEILRVENLSRKGVVDRISFSLRRGEILGISGLVGAGRTEMCRMIFGADYRDSGDIFVCGRQVKIESPKDAIKCGIAYLTEDRKSEGLILKFSVGMNISMVDLKNIQTGRFLDRKKEQKFAEEQIQKLNIKTPSVRQKASNLSGGNQQKIVVAKWMCTDVDIFIFDEPTRGIDVGAKYEIYLLIHQLVSQGKAVIMISSDLPEIIGLSNRVLVMKEGKITGELTGDEIDAENVMKYSVQEI